MSARRFTGAPETSKRRVQHESRINALEQISSLVPGTVHSCENRVSIHRRGLSRAETQPARAAVSSYSIALGFLLKFHLKFWLSCPGGLRDHASRSASQPPWHTGWAAASGYVRRPAPRFPVRVALVDLYSELGLLLHRSLRFGFGTVSQ
jgi:hypothetical protein